MTTIFAERGKILLLSDITLGMSDKAMRAALTYKVFDKIKLE